MPPGDGGRRMTWQVLAETRAENFTGTRERTQPSGRRAQQSHGYGRQPGRAVPAGRGSRYAVPPGGTRLPPGEWRPPAYTAGDSRDHPPEIHRHRAAEAVSNRADAAAGGARPTGAHRPRAGARDFGPAPRRAPRALREDSRCTSSRTSCTCWWLRASRRERCCSSPWRSGCAGAEGSPPGCRNHTLGMAFPASHRVRPGLAAGGYRRVGIPARDDRRSHPGRPGYPARRVVPHHVRGPRLAGRPVRHRPAAQDRCPACAGRAHGGGRRSLLQRGPGHPPAEPAVDAGPDPASESRVRRRRWFEQGRLHAGPAGVPRPGRGRRRESELGPHRERREAARARRGGQGHS